MVTSRPSKWPGMMVPPYRKTAGTFRRAIASIIPGRLLSQPAMATSASKASATTMSSTESAMISRLTRDAFIPSWPMAIASLTAIVVNWIGVPFPARTPCLTSLASTSRWRLQGVTSFHEDATPTSGLRRSSSPSPVARSIARWGARSGPSVTCRERVLGSAIVLTMMRDPPANSCGPGRRPDGQVECRPLLRTCNRVLPRGRRTRGRGRRRPASRMIRLICPHCGVAFLRLAPADDGEAVVCPHCRRSFVPEEEEWVDPEDD